MRFGKCATIYKAIKDTNKIANSEKEIKNILILTHRPSVLDSWKNDFINVLGDDNEYKFFSPNQKEYFINDKTKHKILFSSLQDLRGKKSDEATEEYDIDGDVKGDAINTSK
jgi:murein L,D-transpeptidase YafK